MTTLATELRNGVRDAYSSAATAPDADHLFPVGAAFAREVGYAGVFPDLRSDACVLDLGCGAGLDSIVAGRRARMVLGVDFSASMLRRAIQAVNRTNVFFAQCDAERLPVADGTFDSAIVNGIFNLNPARDAIFGELARVMRPGGTVYGAELILREPLSEEQRESASNWFS